MSEVSTTSKHPKNIAKDKRSWWLSHEAFLYLQALAEQQGLSVAQFLESHSRELAQQRLTETQRASVKAEAEQIRAARKQAATQQEF